MSDRLTTPFTFHFAPATGWMNDPNGLIERDGVHHLFFQHNPYGPVFGQIHWGHATSRNLVTWVEQPIALTPGDDASYDQDGCWSGCAVALPDGQVALLYSANRDGRQRPAVAFAADDDLIGWKKSPANPVAEWPAVEGLTDLRDHAVVRAGKCWRQVLAAGRDSAALRATKANGTRTTAHAFRGGRGGMLLSYLSDGDDLTSWTYEGVLLDGGEADLPGEVWECPDLFTTDGLADGEVVVIMSWYTRDIGRDGVHGSDVLWLTGPLRAGRFTPSRYGRLDLGSRFYAPQSYTSADGRRIMFGWLRTQLDPAAEGRPSVGIGSLPRQLTVVDGRLHQAPVVEVDRLERTPVGVLSSSTPGVDLPSPANALELLVRSSDLGGVELGLIGGDGRAMTVRLADLATSSTWLRESGQWLTEPSNSRSARLLFDAGIVEIFTSDGRAAAHSDLRLARIHAITMATADLDATAEVQVIRPYEDTSDGGGRPSPWDPASTSG